MQWDMITLISLIAAAVISILAGLGATYSFVKPKPKQAIQDEQDGWTPTGRIDFADLGSNGGFILQVEDSRLVESIGGVEHREIRWRRATLEEAKRVVLNYHSQRNLMMRAHFVVRSANMIRQEAEPRNGFEAASHGA